MDCTEFRRLQTEYVEGTLNEASKKEAADHVGACEACAQEVKAYVASVKAMAALSVREPPPDLWERFQEYASARERTERVRAWGWVRALFRWRFSEVCKGIIIFMNVTCETATRKLQKYVVEA